MPGHRDAVVALPLGIREVRPIVIALHGNYDRPDWQCEVWGDILGRRAFVLCPRGVPRADAPKAEDRWTYRSIAEVEREIGAALDALKRRFADYLAPDRPVLIGFSLGAIYGVHLLSRQPEQFGHAVLIEGGHLGWTSRLAKSRAAYSSRVLLACGQATCRSRFRGPERLLKAHGAAVRAVSGGDVGHRYDGPVARAVAQELDWLLAPPNPTKDGGSVAPPNTTKDGGTTDGAAPPSARK